MDIDFRNSRTLGKFKPRCPHCDEEIAVGEKYAVIEDAYDENEYYHIGCLQDLDIYEMLKLFGVDIYEKTEEWYEESY